MGGQFSKPCPTLVLEVTVFLKFLTFPLERYFLALCSENMALQQLMCLNHHDVVFPLEIFIGCASFRWREI